jgi:hypothetical protein
MKNRNLIQKKIEHLESNLINLGRFVKTQEPLDTYLKTLDNAIQIIDELRDMIESEPFSPGEINKF